MKLFKFFGKIIVFLFKVIWFPVKWTGKGLWFILKLISWPLSGKAPITARQPATDPLYVLFEESGDISEPEPPKPEPLEKIGSIIPLEEDHDLRTFNILNNEGEIYKIDTSLSGPFYGPVWTRILGCYVDRQTLRGRLIKEVKGNSGRPSGYQVRIGDINTFLPNYHSLRRDAQQGINVRVAIMQINPKTRKVTVSSRIAYDMIFAGKSAPAEGEETEALYWDYDEKYVYFLLPGRCVGKTRYHQKETDVAPLMGETVRCTVESFDPEQREAEIALPQENEAQLVAIPVTESEFPDCDF